MGGLASSAVVAAAAAPGTAAAAVDGAGATVAAAATWGDGKNRSASSGAQDVSLETTCKHSMHRGGRSTGHPKDAHLRQLTHQAPHPRH